MNGHSPGPDSPGHEDNVQPWSPDKAKSSRPKLMAAQGIYPDEPRAILGHRQRDGAQSLAQPHPNARGDATVSSTRTSPGSSQVSKGQLMSPSPSPKISNTVIGPDLGDEGKATKQGSDNHEVSAVKGETTEAKHMNGTISRRLPNDRKMTAQPKPEQERDKVFKLSAAEIKELTSSPESLALHVVNEEDGAPPSIDTVTMNADEVGVATEKTDLLDSRNGSFSPQGRKRGASAAASPTAQQRPDLLSSSKSPGTPDTRQGETSTGSSRPGLPLRTFSSPAPTKEVRSIMSNGLLPPSSSIKPGRPVPSPLKLGAMGSPAFDPQSTPAPEPSPMPPSIPLPPLSFPTYLQLELSSSRPSPLYIHRSATSDFPYESSKVKFERLLNFLLLPPQLEGVLWFGALACLDAWLYSFTILPLRFLKAVGVLCQWWGSMLIKEANDITSFIFWGTGRMWQRRRLTANDASAATPSRDGSRSRAASGAGSTPRPGRTPASEKSGGITASGAGSTLKPGRSPAVDTSGDTAGSTPQPTPASRRVRSTTRRHRRTRSTPSMLLPSHKADLLKGLVVLFSCLVLTRFDASRMYHGIRGQAAIKLYVIYNVLEVCDRLFSALGQDVFECLFSRETLERNADGRSKILRPFGMFLLALSYNVIHSTALFYQVITLNVAVNSYSNALLTLLMSNQFVEIKSTVFKKFEKENLFQLTCADVVERFQLWLMLMIIAMRNVVEVGGLSLSASMSDPASLGNSTASSFKSGSIIPKSFTIFPKWTGQVLGPFLLVLGSEMLVDWLKHAYITKFNNTKPAIYGRFLDVLAKDYYSNAFADQNLTRRLGLPVIPLSCLFIRASLQTYHMFLATNVPFPLPSSATSLSASSSPASTAALAHFDAVVRRALGRSSFGAGGSEASSSPFSYTTDDAIAFLTMLLFFLAAFLVLLALKLVLGMLLLGFARARYKGMKERERAPMFDPGGRRVGGWGVVEVDDDKRRWIYGDDADGARAARDRDRALRERAERPDGSGFGHVSRYTMVAKRIW
ncbi:MAG: hypothetical protein M1832_000188 [Thelocarpon impressellum]|nr:MAG: hypothetical protein M1832_000188 [Thelocarpon impressellum]